MINRTKLAISLPMDRSVAALLLVVFCGAEFKPAMAAIDLTASGSVATEYNSNPLEFSKGEAFTFAPGGISDVDDTGTALTAIVSAKSDATGPIGFQALGRYRHTESKRFNALGHDEYEINGNLDWRLSKPFDMSLAASQNREPIRQADVDGAGSALKTTTLAQATLRLRPTARWQIALRPTWTSIKLPLPEARGFRFRENAATATLGYLATGLLVPGLEVSESQGLYTGIDGAIRYRQRTAWGTLNYQATGLSIFTLAVGHTQRVARLVDQTDDPADLANAGNTGEFTGNIGYQRQLTAKTGIKINAFRNFQQYDAGVNMSVGTGFNAAVTWAATPKITVTLNNGNVWSTIDGVKVDEAIIQRKDLVRSLELQVNYNFTRRLAVRTYGTRRIRNSTVAPDQFNTTLVGIELTAMVE